MVNIKLSDQVIGQIRGFLELGLRMTEIVKRLGQQNVAISERQIYRIKSWDTRREEKVRTSVRPGPSRALSDRQVTALVQEAKKPNPARQKVLAKKFGVSQQLVSLTLKREGLKTYKKPKGHQLTETMAEKRRRRSWPLYLQLNAGKWKKFVTVEALFHVDENGIQTDHQYVHDKSELIVRQKKNFPLSLMVFVGLSARGPSRVIFVEPGAKISAKYYIDKVLKPFFKDVKKRLYPDGDFIFHQDSAPSHSAKMTREWLQTQKINYITPDEWLPNSPDAAPCDFFLWGYLKDKLKDRMCRTRDELKKEIRRAVKSVPQNLIDKALQAWPKRLREIYDAGGHHIENWRKSVQ